MLSIPGNVRVYLCTAATDMRKGFDGLHTLVLQVFGRDPLDGHLFLFVNRRRDRLKMLWWDRDGMALFYKRLEAGTYQLPAVAADSEGIEIDATDLAILLSGIDVQSARRRKRYSRVA
ncbi:MAG: IS66 family insertion sequence element accessory protein TnpB [Planctomycetaceae bacterium]